MKFEIITPSEKFYSAEVSYVYAPGESGYFGILKDHVPFLTTLKDGKIKVTLENGKDKEFHVSGGLADIKDNHIKILAESVEAA